MMTLPPWTRQELSRRGEPGGRCVDQRESCRGLRGVHLDPAGLFPDRLPKARIAYSACLLTLLSSLAKRVSAPPAGVNALDAVIQAFNGAFSQTRLQSDRLSEGLRAALDISPTPIQQCHTFKGRWFTYKGCRCEQGSQRCGSR
jgi:hypothetical protein